MSENTMDRMTWMLAVVAVILLIVLSGTVSAQDSTDGPYIDHGFQLSGEQLNAARVAAGEVSAALFGGPAYLETLCTMGNRVKSSRFPDTLSAVVEQGYFAPPRLLTTQEYRIAEDYFGGFSWCLSTPRYYVLSQQDVEAHGLPNGDLWFPYTLPSGTVLAAHFYSTWPEGAK